MTETVRVQRPRTAPIVPERSVAGRTLMFLIAIMTFLSGVTLGGVVLVQKSAIAWSADVGREVTIQIKPEPGEVMESNLRLAVSLAEATPGVASARALTLEESQNLLKPWLGEGLDIVPGFGFRLLLRSESNTFYSRMYVPTNPSTMSR